VSARSSLQHAHEVDFLLITVMYYYMEQRFCASVSCCWQGAATQCYVAVNPAVAGVSGKFFMDSREAEDAASAFSKDEVMAKRLWEVSEKLIGKLGSGDVRGSCFPLAATDSEG